MITSPSIAKIAPALIKAQKSMGDATKGSKNPFFKSSYSDLNSVREAVTPALHENGIALLQPTVYIGGLQFIQTTLVHESGETIAGLTQVVVAKQNDPQASGSGISYARRYGLMALLSVGTTDDDGEAAMDRPRVKLAEKPTDSTPTTPVVKAAGSFKPNKVEAKVESTKESEPSAPQQSSQATNDGW